MEDEELRRLAEEWIRGKIMSTLGTETFSRRATELEALLRRVAEEARRQERERCSGHFEMTTAPRCYECGDQWPCPTVLRIRGGE